MVKTLRITSIIMVVVAAVLLVFPVLFGVRGNKDIEKFLAAAGAIDKFKETADNQAKNAENHSSPLIKQAEAFTLFLNPPKPVEAPEDSQLSGIPRPQAVASRFKLIGTSYSADHPELSLALIDEPGKGMHWIKQAAEVGHLIVEKIRDGAVVVKDGLKTFEITTEKLEKANPLIRDSSAPATASSPVLAAAKSDKPDIAAQPAGTGRPQPARQSKSQRHFDINKAGALEKALITGNPDTEGLSEEEKKLAGKAFAELGAARVSVAEANKLDNLGKELKDAQKKDDPNKYYRRDRARRGRRTSAP